MKQHRKKYVFGTLLFWGILLIGGTVAYFTAFDQKVNRIAVGHNTTGIVEDFPDPGVVSADENPKCNKKVWVSNKSGGEEGFEVDCYVRVSLSYSNWDIGKAVTLQNLNTRDWIYAEDGFYYYQPVLKKGKSTSPLFTGFSIRSDELEDEYKAYLSDFTITVYEESVQAEGFQNAWEAWAYFSNPVSGR